ncbi:MAG: hypothetical protein KDA69_21445, partial [Planctomycetaceae bacterium]|nr:hypothetical protein [Planctomycetaceae bacterium]
MPRHTLFFLSVILAANCVQSSKADEYSETIHPYMQQYCMECHAGKEAKGELDLAMFSADADVIQSFRRWKHII